MLFLPADNNYFLLTRCYYCASMTASAHHPETWNPNWNLRTLVLSLRGFMTTQPREIGSISTTAIHQRSYAMLSRNYICRHCGVDHSKLLPCSSEHLHTLSGPSCEDTSDATRREVVLGNKVGLNYAAYIAGLKIQRGRNSHRRIALKSDVSSKGRKSSSARSERAFRSRVDGSRQAKIDHRSIVSLAASGVRRKIMYMLSLAAVLLFRWWMMVGDANQSTSGISQGYYDLFR